MIGAERATTDEGADGREQQALAYEPPQLDVMGTVEDLTAGGGGRRTDFDTFRFS